MRIEFFLARRYLQPQRNTVSIITLVSVIGVMLGVAVLIVAMAVMTGFSNTMHEKMLQTEPHMMVQRSDNYAIVNTQPVMKALERAGVRAASSIAGTAMLLSDKEFHPLVMYGVEPEVVANEMDFENVLLPGGSFDLNPGEIVVSDTIGARFRLSLGDRVLIHSQARLAEMIDFSESGAVTLRETKEVSLPAEYTVAGFYHFGKSDFDARFVFMNVDDAAELFRLPWGSATAVVGWVDAPMNINQYAATAGKLLSTNYHVSTWEDRNSQLLFILKMEKRMIFFLLIFIVLVASFSICNTLITSVYLKTRDIGLLKALGANNWQMTMVFVFQGFLTGLVGATLGVIMGVVVVIYRMNIMRFLENFTGNEQIFPKEFYYFDELPAQIVATDLVAIIAISILLCTIGGMLPAWRAARLDPANAFRNE